MLARSACVFIPKREHGTLLQHAESLSLSTPWIQSMKILENILTGLIRYGDLEALRRTQRVLLRGGLLLQIHALLDGYQKSSCPEVVIAIIKMSVLMAWQFPTAVFRWVCEGNVRKLCRTLVEFCLMNLVTREERDQYIIMMLIMSDFGYWLHYSGGGGGDRDKVMHNDNDHAAASAHERSKQWLRKENNVLQNIFDECSPRLFIEFGLASWNPKTSPSFRTRMQIYRKMQWCFDKLTANHHMSSVGGPLLHTLLQYAVSFAWNSHDIVPTTSCLGMYRAAVASVLFCHHGHSLFYHCDPQPGLGDLCASWTRECVDRDRHNVDDDTNDNNCNHPAPLLRTMIDPTDNASPHACLTLTADERDKMVMSRILQWKQCQYGDDGFPIRRQTILPALHKTNLDGLHASHMKDEQHLFWPIPNRSNPAEPMLQLKLPENDDSYRLYDFVSKSETLDESQNPVHRRVLETIQISGRSFTPRTLLSELPICTSRGRRNRRRPSGGSVLHSCRWFRSRFRLHGRHSWGTSLFHRVERVRRHVDHLRLESRRGFQSRALYHCG
jgi:hypothetical protein